MRPDALRGFRLHSLVASTLLPLGTAWCGCGSSGVTEARLTDEARKAVFLKKVDVQHRSSPSRSAKTQAKPR
jgi:hypothetical protein